VDRRARRPAALVLVVLAVAAAGVPVGSAAARVGVARAERPVAARNGSFPMPMDTGPRLLAQRAQAAADLAAWTPELERRRAQAVQVQQRWEALEVRLAETDAVARRLAKRLADARGKLARAAADAYVHGSPTQLGASLDAVLSARDVLDLSRDMKLIGQYGSEHVQAAARYRDLKEEADAEVLYLSDQRARIVAESSRLRVAVDEAAGWIADSQRRYDEAVEGLERFHVVAVDADSPIRGPSLLTAEELAGFVRAKGHEPRLTVSLDELARAFVEEGDAEVVRGDVAFAQSILESGWFSFPAGGQVDPDDNNFAGIGACDGCDHGFRFDSARLGVRAQVQLLRTYVSDDIGPDDLAYPSLLPGTFRLGFRGDVQSWNDLTGRWATASGYGTRVYALYRQMVDWARGA
jgi:hypothetical protein